MQGARFVRQMRQAPAPERSICASCGEKDRAAERKVAGLCVKCGQNRLPQESERHTCPAHRRRPKPPLPQGVGALAAPERNDRAATPERVPHRLPAAEVTKRGTARKPARSDFTHRASAARRDRHGNVVTVTQGEPSHMLPHDPFGAETAVAAHGNAANITALAWLDVPPAVAERPHHRRRRGGARGASRPGATLPMIDRHATCSQPRVTA